MSTDVTSKIDELGRAIHQFKADNDKLQAELKAKGHAPADLIEKVDKSNTAISELQAEIKAVKLAMARTPNAENEKSGRSEYSKKFQGYLRGKVTGDELKSEFPKIEMKELQVQIDEDGGFLVSPEMSSEIVTKVYESSPVRQLASVQTISSDALEILEDLDELTVGWVGETQARPTTTTPKLKMIKIPVHELYAQPSATQKILDDAAINMESWLAGKVADKFARAEATAFVSGDGVAKPRGFLSYAAGTGFEQIEQVPSGAAAALTPDGLIELFYSLKSAYRANATWGMKRATVKELRKFKDNEDQYLWLPGLNGDQQDTFLGKPIVEMDDMPTVGASNLAVVFGDFKQGYQIVDRIGIRVIRDIYTAKPSVLFYTTKRVGGAVKNFEALKLQIVSM